MFDNNEHNGHCWYDTINFDIDNCYMIHIVFRKESYGQKTCCTESYDNQEIHFLCGGISPFYFIPIPLSQFPPKTSRASNNELNFGDKLSKLQECIPVGGVSEHALDRGCVSQHALARGCLPRGCLPRESLPIEGVCPSGCVCPGGVCPGGVCPGGVCPGRCLPVGGCLPDTPLSPVNRMTDRRL